MRWCRMLGANISMTLLCIPFYRSVESTWSSSVLESCFIAYVTEIPGTQWSGGRLGGSVCSCRRVLVVGWMVWGFRMYCRTDGHQQKLRTAWESDVSWSEAFTRFVIGCGLFLVLYTELCRQYVWRWVFHSAVLPFCILLRLCSIDVVPFVCLRL